MTKSVSSWEDSGVCVQCVFVIQTVTTFLLQNFGYMTGSDALLKKEHFCVPRLVVLDETEKKPRLVLLDQTEKHVTQEAKACSCKCFLYKACVVPSKRKPSTTFFLQGLCRS